MARRRHLGKLTKTPTSSAPSAEAKRVVAAFLRGEAARGACKGKGEARVCAIVTDGRILEVGGDIVANREGARMTVCVPTTAITQVRKGKKRETEEAKDVRVTASMLLRRAAGIGVRTNAGGDRLLASKGRAALLLPTACLQVQLPKRQAALLVAANNATEAAKARYKTSYPSHRQVEAMRKMLVAEKRMAALFMARQKRGKGRKAATSADEYDYTPAPEDRGVPFNVEDLLEPVAGGYEYPPESWEAVEAQAADLPKDVPNPTNPDDYARFVAEYLPKLRAGAKRDMALAWQAYLLNPKGMPRPGAGTEVPPRIRSAARAVENTLANEYGIADPIYGWETPDEARASALRARARIKMRASGRKPTRVQSQDKGVRAAAQARAEEFRQRTKKDIFD